MTEADVCGVPVPESTPNSRVQTRAFISAEFTTELETGSEITQKRADGTICVTDKAPDQLKRLNMSLVVCGLPFPMLQLALGMNAFVDGDGNIIGGALPSRSQQAEIEANETLQIEIWQFNKDPEACAGGTAGSAPYVRNIFPLVRNRQLAGSINIAEGVASELTIEAIVEETAGYEPSDPADPIMSIPANTTTMQTSGPWGYFCDDTLPDPIEDCAYVAATS